MSQPNPAEFRTPDAYPLNVGDRVYDIRQLCIDELEAEPAIVIDTLEDDVYTADFEDTSGEEVVLAEYEPNIAYARFAVSSRVVTIAWESWLDNHTPGWDDCRDDPDELARHLTHFEESWGIPVSTKGSYDYPESRLRLIDRPRTP